MKKLILFTWLCVPLWVSAAVITVDRADDLITGGDGGCDLREAVNSANLNLALDDCTAGDDSVIDIILIDVGEPIQLQAEISVIGSVLISRLATRPNIQILAGTNERHFVLNMTEANDDDFGMVGLHLQNGNPGDHGGAILISDAGTVEITDSIFENNTGHDGGAIHGLTSLMTDFKLLRNHFINNTASQIDDDSAGGALYGINITAGTLTIENNLFQGNQADFGGAIFINEGSDTITLSRNRFYHNHATENGGALMLRSLTTGQTYQLDSNVLLHNSANNSGGAIYGFSAGALRIDIINSTLGMNIAANGGALASGGGNIQVISSTLAHNGASLSGAQAYQTNNGIINFSKSILAYAQAGNNCGGSVGGLLDNIDDDGSCDFDLNEGNLEADPQLSGLREYTNANPDVPLLLPGFQLTVDSPAIDHEDDALCWVPPGADLNEDQNEQSRDIDGDGDGQIACDLGALEAPANNDLIYQDSMGV